MTGPVPTGGLSQKLIGSDDVLVPLARWNQLAAMQAVIGVCRLPDCAADVFAVANTEGGEEGKVTWYETICANGHERAAPNGRVLRRSSAHGEMPGPWWEDREKRDAAARSGEEG